MQPLRERGLPRRLVLKHKSLISGLFDRNSADNQSVSFGTIRILFRFMPLNDPQVPFLVAFASGKHKKAVTRNQIKRFLRANFQNHRHLLPSEPFILMILYRGKAAEARLRIPLDLPVALQKISRPTV